MSDDGDDFRQARQVRRYTSGSWSVAGDWVPGLVLREVSVYMSLQPATTRDMQSLAEGRRDRSMYAIFTDSLLQVENIEKQTNPDVVVLDDGLYEVTQSSPWRNNVINHYRYIITRASKVTG